MTAVSGKRFCRILESKGWQLKRINGSHHIYAKAGNTARISVPVHGNTPLKTGLLRHLMKIAEIEESESQSCINLKKLTNSPMPQNIIYHNPRCSKSRETLKLLQDNAMPVEIIEYLKTPPSVHVLDGLCTLLGLTPQELLRSKENRFKELSLSLKDARSREEWLQILADNPKLIERPIVVYNGRATLGRPPQRVLELKS